MIFTVRPAEMLLWRTFWGVSVLTLDYFWRPAFQILVLMPMLGWLFRNHKAQRLWLTLEMTWWIFIGVFYIVSSKISPGEIFPIVMAWMAFVAYLEEGHWISDAKKD